MGIETKGMSRRSFLGAGAVVAAGAAFAGLAGCSPSGETKGAEAMSAAAAGETRDLGSASFELTADTKQADETKEVDIVVVGSGMGGFSAALTAIEEGAKSVVLLEKNNSLGGSTNMAECPAGARPFEYTEEEARAAAAGAQADSYGVSDPMLLYSMFRDAKENFSWLFDTHGVGWTKQGEAPAFYEGGNGKIAIEKLAAAAEKEDGLEVLTETPATQLLLSDEYTVEGVRAKTKDGKYVDYKARPSCSQRAACPRTRPCSPGTRAKTLIRRNWLGPRPRAGDGHLMAEQTAHGRANQPHGQTPCSIT